MLEAGREAGFSASALHRVPATISSLDLVSCTLTSSGFNFGQPWSLTGIFIP